MVKMSGIGPTEKLPNERALVLIGAFSIVGVICTLGILTIPASVLGIIYFFKDRKLYRENPGMYERRSFIHLAYGAVMCAIGLMAALAMLALLAIGWLPIVYGWIKELIEVAKNSVP